jgi:hypothetical protein
MQLPMPASHSLTVSSADPESTRRLLLLLPEAPSWLLNWLTEKTVRE